jgi:hypothetical protein
MRKLLLSILFLFYQSSFGQNEFLVNTFLDSTQRDPHIEKDGNGNYCIVWNSDFQFSSTSQGDIYFQLFNSNDVKIGTEQIVNTTTSGDQEKPALAMNSLGTFVIAWASYTDFNSIYDVKARLYKNNSPVGSEISVNTTINYSQTNPEVAIDNNGNFIVVWESWYQDGSDRGLFAQRFDSNGNKVGTEFSINSTTAYSQSRPVVKYFYDGRFIVIWESWRQDITTVGGYGVFGRIFNNNGTPVSGEFQINTVTTDYQWYGDIEIFNDNSFVVVWCSWEQDGHDGGIYYQRFNANGQKVGGEILVNKTTNEYQWLPRVHKLTEKKLAFVWSSWKQDGSRDGIYTTFFDEFDRRITFETQVNQFTNQFQWEPDFIIKDSNTVLVTWASWGQYGKDYEIIARKISPEKPVGQIIQSTYQHQQGRTTAKILVHVVDSLALNNHIYEVSFDTAQTSDSAFAHIKDINTGNFKVQNFPLNKGITTFYRTPTFDGIAVEFLPVFKLDLDVNVSNFKNNSGTNLIFTYTPAMTGQRLLAPIDVILIWGNTDTLANGQYAAPLDTAIGLDAVKNIKLPFKAWNITDNQKINMLIKEPTATKNGKWDPKEDIVFLTPPPYQQNSFNTHAQITNNIPAGNVIMPKHGDTNFVFTKRPIKPDDKFRFTASKQNFIDVKENGMILNLFELFQNYPNPFNPVTTIKFSIPQDGRVAINIFNILGEQITTLIDDERKAGTHRVVFNAFRLSSGVYFYTIEYRNKRIARKMLLVK